MRLYSQGALLNTKGEVSNNKRDSTKDVISTSAKMVAMKGGQLKQAPGTVILGPTLFRCIAGLDNKEILELQKAILEKKILLKKAKSLKHMVDMEEMAWRLKTDRVLKNAIIAFFIDLTTEVLTWEKLCEKYNITDVQYEKIKSYSETFVKDSLNRAKKSPPLPKAAITLLSHLYRVAMGIKTTANVIPWSIYGFGFDLNKVESCCAEQVLPFNIVFLRFDSELYSLHSRECISATFFSRLIFALNTMNSETEYVLVSFIDFLYVHMLVEGVQHTATKMTFKIGATQSSNPSIKGEMDFAIVLMYISKEDNYQMIDRIDQANLNIFAHKGLDGFIEKNFIDDFINSFAREDSYVVELYCRGVVLQRSLSKKHRCFGICLDVEEKQLESICSSVFENDPALHQWCDISNQDTDIRNQDTDNTNVFENVDAEIDVQPSGEESESNQDDTETDEHIVTMDEDTAGTSNV
ncbi:hypothetical protein KP509_05G015800 [Ceratopteris richardii]|uniref:Uncharacterized protein n=1 Tax=Ceratopteris richardii TaxID=49495 RepID=A0A8T2USJ0_CERRI|nr:hypothetical protein KP509_05G015800 [Ceratopteris richardii]